MLPTLIFVVSAYLVYALFRIWIGHNRKQFQLYKYHRRKAPLGWVGGTGIGLGLILLIYLVGFPNQYENLRTASLINATWLQDSVMPAQAMQRQEAFPLKHQMEQGQPAYAYLHPETPELQISPEKKATGPRHKRALRKPVTRVKAVKVVAKAPRKEKAPTKPRTKNKKKKPDASAEYLAANSG